MKHLELTQDELKDVADFWSSWIRSGGEGEGPNAFQLEALNDFSFRDAFLFWQVGGVLPEKDMGPAFPRAKVAYELLGPLPTDFNNVLWAQARAMQQINNAGVEVEDTDTGSVMVFAYAIWAILLGNYTEAKTTLTGLLMANLRYAGFKMEQGDDSGILHQDPLIAISYAARVLGKLAETEPLTAQLAAEEAFGVEEGSPAQTFIRKEQGKLSDPESENELAKVLKIIGGKGGDN